MPSPVDSVSCCKEFSREFQKNTGSEYKKTDEKLYIKLNKYGKEDSAIKLAENKIKEHIKNGIKVPSKMIPATTVYELVDEIKKRIK